MNDKWKAYFDGIERDNEERRLEIEAYKRWQRGAQLMLVMAILFLITAVLFWVAIQP
jgi:hypothetical protein